MTIKRAMNYGTAATKLAFLAAMLASVSDCAFAQSVHTQSVREQDYMTTFGGSASASSEAMAQEVGADVNRARAQGLCANMGFNPTEGPFADCVLSIMAGVDPQQTINDSEHVGSD
jgi:hypothetical protein